MSVDISRTLSGPSEAAAVKVVEIDHVILNLGEPPIELDGYKEYTLLVNWCDLSKAGWIQLLLQLAKATF